MAATGQALIVALTGYGQKEDQMRAKEAGFDHHFVKPADPHEIATLISRWQQPPRTPAEARSEKMSTGKPQ